MQDRFALNFTDLGGFAMEGSYSRRKFRRPAVAGSAALAMSATSYSRVVGANERISIGVIGCGSRGVGAHMAGVNEHAKSQNIEITAVCDPWRVRGGGGLAPGQGGGGGGGGGG